jgi:trigger factor
MKVDVKDKSPVEKTISIEIESEKCVKVMDKVLNKISREVTIPGFRKGKAPKTAIVRRFGIDALKKDVLDELIPQAAGEVFKDEKLRPISTPRYTDYDDIVLEEGKPVSFEITFEVKPEFEIKDYKGLELIRIVRDVNVDELVEKQIKELQEQMGSMGVVEEDRPLKEGDIAHVDFESTDQEGNIIKGGSAKNYYMALEREKFIPGFVDNIIGRKAGEEWEFDIKFPEDYPNKEMADKDIHFKVKMMGILKKELPELDDEFAKSVGKYETFEQMKEDLKNRIQESIGNQQKNELQEQAIAKLVDQLKDVVLPPSLVEGHLNRYIEDFRNQVKNLGKSLEEWVAESGSDFEKFRNSFYPQARNAARAELIIDKIAETEKIEATDEDMKKEIEAFAERVNQPPDLVRQIMTRNNYLPVMRYEVRNRKVLDMILENAKITEKSPEQVKADLTGKTAEALAETENSEGTEKKVTAEESSESSKEKDASKG